MEEDVVLYALEDGVARITLNRPDVLNASNGAMSRGLTQAMTAAGADPEARVILLSGAGRAFCAGADAKVLGELSEGSTPASGSGELRYDGFLNLDKPIIAAVHGACVGVGLIMACCSDIRIAASNAFFIAPFAALGLNAEGGLAFLLQQLMGSGNAAEMLMSARRVLAEEALAKGLISRMLPDEGFHEAALDYAKGLARNCAPSALAMIKGQLRAARVQTYDQSLREALDMVRDALKSADFAEAIKARQEKRSPAFPGMTFAFGPPVSST